MSAPGLEEEEAALWLRLAAVVELLPGVLDSQLRRQAGLTHFEYVVLAMLAGAPEQTLRMSALALQTNATLPRLSHVVSRLESRGLLVRRPCPQDGRAFNVTLTEAGAAKLADSTPGHVATVRRYVLDALTPDQLTQLSTITDALLDTIDPDRTMTAFCKQPALAGATNPTAASAGTPRRS